MGAAAPIIAIGMQAASQVHGASSEKKAYNAEARALEENARLTQADGAAAAIDAYRTSRMQMGADIVSMASGGGAAFGGSSADILAANAIERELEVMNLHHSAASEARNLQDQAKQRRKAGKRALIGGLMGAAAGAISNASNLRQQNRIAAQNQKQRNSQKGGYGIPIPTGGR